ncbi:MAG: cytidylate kinase-like family protein [Defluviitaleaceae bacterium]|nr:cytidylate kinase-like family protein [Defluviitaleaceae bacterium]
MGEAVITISREYGSGGRDVGRLLAEELGIPVFDDEIIYMATEKSGMCSASIAKRDEKIKSKFLQNLQRLSMNVPSIRIPSGYSSHAAATAAAKTGYKKTDADELFQAQANVIREIAASGGCVIVGRCSGYILRENPKLLSVFIRGDFEDRVRRTVETYNMPEKDAAGNVKKVDKYRSNHYQFYTGQQWGVAGNYDLTINTSYVGIPGAVSVIKAMIAAKEV